MIHVVVDKDVSILGERQPAYKAAILNVFVALKLESSAFPYAAYLQEDYSLEGQWYIVTPVFWEASHNDVMIVEEGEDLLARGALSAYFEALRHHVSARGGQLFAHNEWTWLLQLPNAPQLDAASSTALVARSLKPHLEALDANLYWQQFITEVEMLFNQVSFSEGQVLMNGIWIWGGAPCPVMSTPIYTNDESAIMPLARVSPNVSLIKRRTSMPDESILYLHAPDDAMVQSVLDLKSDQTWYMPGATVFVKKKSLWKRLKDLFFHKAM